MPAACSTDRALLEKSTKSIIDIKRRTRCKKQRVRFSLAAAAATVVAFATVAATGVAQQENQNNDPPQIVIQAAADPVVVTAHKNTSKG